VDIGGGRTTVFDEFGQYHRRSPQHQVSQKLTGASQGAHRAQRTQLETPITSTAPYASAARSESIWFSVERQKYRFTIRHLTIWLIGETISSLLGLIHRFLKPQAIAIRPKWAAYLSSIHFTSEISVAIPAVSLLCYYESQIALGTESIVVT